MARITAPADRRRSTTNASRGAVEPSSASEPAVVDADELARLGELQTVVLLEAGETFDAARAGPGAIAIPAGDLMRLRELAAAGPTLLVCRSGIRSAALARLLRSEGVARLYALAGRSPSIRAAAAT